MARISGDLGTAPPFLDVSLSTPLVPVKDYVVAEANSLGRATSQIRSLQGLSRSTYSGLLYVNP